MIEAGLDEETLETSLTLQGDWCVKGIPTVGFYRCLHKFLVKWPKSRSMSKTAVGKFYMAIDHRLKQKGSRPDNIYRFVEKIILSDEPDCSYMRYGTGYQQPVATIASEQMEFIASSEPSKDSDLDPATLVGKSIEHKFELDDGEFEWFRGFVVPYNKTTSLRMKVNRNTVTLTL